MSVSSAFVVLLFVVSTVSATPFLYLTCHGGSGDVNNVLKYDLAGKSHGQVLQGTTLDELRGMASFGGQGLYVANAHSSDSRISVFSGCNSNGMRDFLYDFLNTANASGLVHPYGVAVDPRNSNVYVSNQDTNCVIRYYGPSSGHTGPVPSPSGVPSSAYPGTFIQLDSSSNGVRDIAFGIRKNAQRLFVCSKDDGGVLILDDDANTEATFTVKKPIGLFFDNSTQLMFVSSSDKSNPSVISFDPNSLEVVNTYAQSDITHPAGIVVYNGVLYVAAQDTSDIRKFDVASGDYLGVLATVKCPLEQLFLSNC